jgi:hypothetical protein
MNQTGTLKVRNGPGASIAIQIVGATMGVAEVRARANLLKY